MARPRKVGRPPKKKAVELILPRLRLPKADLYVVMYADNDIPDGSEGADAHVFKSVSELEEYMRDVDDCGGVYYVYLINAPVIQVFVDPDDTDTLPPRVFTIRGG